MNKKVLEWDELCQNAESLFLDMNKFQKIEPFFHSIPVPVFQKYAEKALEDFPMEEAEKRFSPQELKQFLLLCIVANYGSLTELYRTREYPVPMLDELRRDLRVWLDTLARDFPYYGLTERIFIWEQSCFCGAVKQFGRLQANDIHFFLPKLSLYRQSDRLIALPAFEKLNPPHPDLSYQDKVVNLHIPASGALSQNACIASFRRIQEFMSEFHPDFDWKALVCYSWLLDAQFQSILGSDSNILKFQRMGHLLDMPGSDETNEVIWRIWGEKGLRQSAGELSRNTSMEDGVADFLQKGGRFREGIMVIFRDEIESLLYYF